MMLHILGALLLPLCGWLAGDAIQARTVQHLAALQRCLALLERIRQEVAFRRADLQQLYAELCREGILESGARCLQEAPPPEGLTREEQQCFRTCMSGLGRAEAQQERTAGLLPGPPAGFAANGRTRCPAAGRSAPQTGPCSRDGNGTAAHLNSEILEETAQMEIDLVFKIAAIGIIVAVLNQLLIRSGREDQAMMTTLAGLVVVLSILVKQISTLFVTIKALFSL